MSEGIGVREGWEERRTQQRERMKRGKEAGRQNPFFFLSPPGYFAQWILKMSCSLNVAIYEQPKHHLEVCLKDKFLGPTPDRLNQNL